MLAMMRIYKEVVTDCFQSACWHRSTVISLCRKRRVSSVSGLTPPVSNL